ncbi:MAG: response regulator [Crocinitomicaceae bacterium]|nr:response regulator [Crocinitomicaceae bacterium]
MKTFIIEDNKFYANVLNARLEKFMEGSIDIYHSGKEALNNIYKQPNLIFLDYNLPDIKGLDILKQIKSTYPNIQVVLLSGQEKIEIAVNCLRYGAMDYIIKNNEDHNERIEKIFNDLKEFELDINPKKSSTPFFRRLFNF